MLNSLKATGSAGIETNGKILKLFFKPLPTKSANSQTKPTVGAGINLQGRLGVAGYFKEPFPSEVAIYRGFFTQEIFSSCRAFKKRVTVVTIVIV
jgi:hypothetical protein